MVINVDTQIDWETQMNSEHLFGSGVTVSYHSSFKYNVALNDYHIIHHHYYYWTHFISVFNYVLTFK